QEAIDDYTTAIKINPEYALAYLNRGISKAYLSIDCCRDFKRACELGNESGCRNFKIVNCN
ncbi:tetratricopeptide repeat protein, partial [Crocinitomicaceae bacterium]|nr:tetratricopeptide repeat protein [Crocinitomicaceae bacterium]